MPHYTAAQGVAWWHKGHWNLKIENMAVFQWWVHIASMQAFRRIPLVSVASLHTSPFPSPQMTAWIVPGGAFENQWSFVWSEWNMDNDHIEKREKVASWLVPPDCKTGKTKTTTAYFYHQIKPKRSYPLSPWGATLTSPLGTHTGLFTRTQLDSQLWIKIRGAGICKLEIIFQRCKCDLCTVLSCGSQDLYSRRFWADSLTAMKMCWHGGKDGGHRLLSWSLVQRFEPLATRH